MRDQSGDSTLQTKHGFEHLCETCNVKVKHYHADNDHFAERTFTDDVEKSLQGITFYGVGAHHQNEITNDTIKQLTFISRTLLGHVQGLWPEYTTTMIWLYALKSAQYDMALSGVESTKLCTRDFHT